MKKRSFAANKLVASLFLISISTIVCLLISCLQGVSAEKFSFHEEIQINNDFYEDPNSGIMIKHYTNVHGHVYPYTATAVTLTCIIVVLVTIIVCGSNL
jgi:hypothetical protein